MTTKDIDSTENIVNSPATFVIPFYGDQEKSLQYLEEAIDSLLAQTDSNWNAVIVDDATPGDAHKEYLKNLESRYPQKIKVLWQKVNQGQGFSRNVAVRWAFEKGYPIILFQDDDDISHPDRLKVVREIFLEQPEVGLVYSGFKVVDENGQPVPYHQIAPSVADIIQACESSPVEGYEAWIKIGTVTGFACLPSSTAVRTSVAYKCPFPRAEVSEDSYTWMHISALGYAFKFAPTIPSFYRIPSGKESSHRSRIGKNKFYEEKAKTDIDGFFNAINVSLSRGAIKQEQVDEIKIKFFKRLSETLMEEGEAALAEKLLKDFV